MTKKLDFCEFDNSWELKWYNLLSKQENHGMQKKDFPGCPRLTKLELCCASLKVFLLCNYFQCQLKEQSKRLICLPGIEGSNNLIEKNYRTFQAIYLIQNYDTVFESSTSTCTYNVWRFLPSSSISTGLRAKAVSLKHNFNCQH